MPARCSHRYLFIFLFSLIEFSCHKSEVKYTFRVNCVHGYHTVVFSSVVLFAEFRTSETRFVQDTNVNTPIHTSFVCLTGVD